MNIKSIKYLLIVTCILHGSCHLHAQQRTKSQLKEIVSVFQNKLSHKKIFDKKISSSQLFKEYNLGSNQEAFHIYTSSNSVNGAFVIVSADKKMPRVLAYSDNNSFDIENMPPAVKYWLDTYVAVLNDSIHNYSASKNLRSIYKNDGVAPLLGGVIWGQSAPFNKLCPTYRGVSTLTGCVATAMAQVMKYHSFPEQAHGYTDYTTSTNRISVSHDFSEDIFHWSDMLTSYNSNYTDIQGRAVAVLMASCGASVEMDYGTSNQGGSGAYQSDLIKGYINNYGYDRDASLVVRNYCSTDDWHSLLIKELNEGRPVNYAGSSVKDGGHSFVIDGYRIGSEAYPDYHINWGWSGSCDGYYQIANLHPYEGDSYATYAPFSESQQMTIGVMPDDGIDNKHYMFVSSKLNSNLLKAKKGSTISFNVSSLYNCSYKVFNGYISVALKSSNGQLYILGAGKKYQLEYLQGPGNMNIDVTVPDGIGFEKYTAHLIYKPVDTDVWNEVLSYSYPTIEITETEEDKPITDLWSDIGCSEIELLQENGNNVLSANIYELINLQQENFDGYLSFTFADENGSPMFSFGHGDYISELGYYDFLTEPKHITGSINKVIPDGHYRLYISSKRKGQKTESFVVYNDLAVLGSPTRELFFRVEVKKSKAYIDGKEYNIIPTDIKENLLRSTSMKLTYSVSGQIVDTTNRKKGMYIQYINGVAKKMFFN